MQANEEINSNEPPAHAIASSERAHGHTSLIAPIAIAAGVLVILAAGALTVRRSESRVNTVALSDAPKAVSVVAAKATSFRPSRTYVGTTEPWIQAQIGPQLVSAYVDTVLVRPGAVVKKGEVIATLDCRNANATSQAVSMQARALEAQQEALSHEANRVQGLLDGGFVSPNEAEQKSAQSSAEQAQLLATKAKLLGTTLEVNDCVLRAPFDGEVAVRSSDPGAFVRPGTSLVTLVDRRVVRITADAPESDFDVVKPGGGVSIHLLATGRDLTGQIARRAPAADVETRTVHFEIDVVDPNKDIPVGTTAELHIEVGVPVATAEIPLSAAAVRGEKASVFCVKDGVAVARTLKLKGEANGQLYVDTATLAPGALVVTEGRALLDDGDKVQATVEPTAATSAPQPSKGG